jgi:hypothetical protein
MIKHLIAIALLASLVPACDKNCNAPGKPVFPAIGGCIQTAAPGQVGGSCNIGNCDGDLQCIGGICYECGKAGNPPEPCCGTQSTTDHGHCESGTCAPDPNGDGWYSCLGGVVNDPDSNCAPGEKAEFRVWFLTPDCIADHLDFCAPDDMSPQEFADAKLAGVVHGDVATDPTSTAPTLTFACASGPGCTISPENNEDKVTSFFVFKPDQIASCEQHIDPNCPVWVDAPNNMCPAP